VDELSCEHVQINCLYDLFGNGLSLDFLEVTLFNLNRNFWIWNLSFHSLSHSLLFHDQSLNFREDPDREKIRKEDQEKERHMFWKDKKAENLNSIFYPILMQVMFVLYDHLNHPNHLIPFSLYLSHNYLSFFIIL
jgi:hypothetical protein